MFNKKIKNCHKSYCDPLSIHSEKNFFFIKYYFFLYSRSGFVCMAFYRRDGHVVELQTGNPVSRPEDACLPAHYQPRSTPFLTLVSKYSENDPFQFFFTFPKKNEFRYSNQQNSTKFSIGTISSLTHSKKKRINDD